MKGRPLVRALEKLAGPGNVLSSPVSLATYGYDATLLEGRADAVVFPTSTEQVSALLAFCHRHRVSVVPRGHGTNLSGGSVPQGGVVMALTRMNRVLSVDAPNRLAVVQCGVINLDLQKAAERAGLMYAPDPASQKVCSLGGNVAEGAGGMRGLKYGVTKDHVIGLKFVLADGEVCQAGGGLQPVAPVPDWTGLLVGSEGTLGVVTEITVRLIPRPPAVKTMLAVFDRLEDATATVSAIVARGIVPTTLELMDRPVVEAVEAYVHVGLPTDAEVVLLIEVDGLEAGLDRQAEVVQDVCRGQGAREVRLARSAAERDRLWLGRRTAIGAIARLAPCYDLEDVTVPRNRLTDMARVVRELSQKYDLTIGILAHAGDGNLHPLVLFDDRDADEVNRMMGARRELFRRALDLGGTLTGEHGIGLLKKEFMPWLFSPRELRTMDHVKAAFDPAGVLNPGKVLGEGSAPKQPERSPDAAARDRLVSRLEGLLGPAAVAAGDQLDGAPGRVPDVWAAPADEPQLRELLGWATRERVPVYPRGGGTRWAEAFRPFRGGVGLDLRRLDRMEDLDADNLTVVAGAGMTHETLQRALAAHRLFWPSETAWPQRSTLGGEVATDASGPRRYGWGSVRSHLLGCRVVFPDGSGGLFGGKQVKNVSGYDVSRFLCGSWGSLGVITQVILKVRPRPERSLVRVYEGPARGVLRAAEEVRLGLFGAVAIEVLLGQAVGWFHGRASGHLPFDQGVLLVGLEGAEEAVAWQTARADKVAAGQGLTLRPQGPEAQGVWRALRALPDLARRSGLAVWNLAVLPADLEGLLASLAEPGAAAAGGAPGGAVVGVAAHAGNGHARLFVTPENGGPPEGGQLAEVGARVRTRGGCLAPEDAVLADSPFRVLPATGSLGPVWQRLKNVLDPAGIMGPAGRIGDRAG